MHKSVKLLPNPEYIQINPPFDQTNGYSFNKPGDIYYGVDNFLYIADTDNNRIVMMDQGGAIQGVSQFVPTPVRITQNDSLALLVVSGTNAIYKLDMFDYQHNIASIPIDTVFVEETRPNHQYTGITVHNGFEYYVTVIDRTPGSYKSYIYDFRRDNFLKGPLPLEQNGSGLFATMLPTSIISLREEHLDDNPSKEDTEGFIFSHTGKIDDIQVQNFYKIQYVGTAIVEEDVILVPNIRLIGSDIYDFNKFYDVQDVAIDRSGFMFAVESGMDSDQDEFQPGFYRFSSSGKQQQALLKFGSGEAQFNHPHGIAVSPNAEEDQVVYIADTGNDRILRFKLSTD